MNDKVTGSPEKADPADGASRPAESEMGITPHPTGSQDNRITDSPRPAPAEAGKRPSRSVQWVVAGVVLAVMVFVITFAMNYLGGPPRRSQMRNVNPDLDLTLDFVLGKQAPIGEFLVEDEAGKPNHQDFWFVNRNDKEIVIGLKRKACRCSAVDVFVLPDGRASPTTAALLVATGPRQALGNLPLLGFPAYGWHDQVDSVELLQQQAMTTIPAGAAGWMRVRWTGEKPGPQGIEATFWMNDKDSGPEATVGVRTFHHEPIRVRPLTPLSSLTEEELARGVTRHIEVWSSTRQSFALEAKPAAVRAGKPESDPFEVGAPVALTPAELAELEKRNNTPNPDEMNPMPGKVLSGYRVTVTLRAVSRDGKVPFDIGQFKRDVVLSSRDVAGEPKVIPVQGRVRGLVELGVDDEAGTINFGPFARRDGVRRNLQITSAVKDLTLKVDEKRTPVWLLAKLKGPTLLGEDKSRQSWTLQVQVIPGKVSGPFPRAGDPLFEDCAVYLRATTGKDGPERAIRIPVRGTANES